MSPPTLTSRIMRRKVRYSFERELGAAPWKEMKMSWAISSRSVRGFIQRRTVADVLMGGAGAAALGGAFSVGLAARARGDAANAAQSVTKSTARIRRGRSELTIL